MLNGVGERFGHRFDMRSGPIGGNAIDRYGTALPDETLEACQDVDAVLFGAAGGPKWDVADAKERPEQGILRIRREFGLFANIRPAKSHPALYAASSLKPEYLEGVDLIVLRELIGGLYFSRPKKRWATKTGKRRGMDTLKYSEEEIARVVRVGFELARQRRGKLVSTDKFNVMESSRLWREVATEVGTEYPDVELEHILADNLAMQLLRNPRSIRRDRGEQHIRRSVVGRGRHADRFAGDASIREPCRAAGRGRQREAPVRAVRACTRQRAGHRG